jgi:hypothetical protein
LSEALVGTSAAKHRTHTRLQPTKGTANQPIRWTGKHNGTQRPGKESLLACELSDRKSGDVQPAALVSKSFIFGKEPLPFFRPEKKDIKLFPKSYSKLWKRILKSLNFYVYFDLNFS